jgi:NADPH-dependent 7-cyano-7-deazaguanine reductase QueF
VNLERNLPMRCTYETNMKCRCPVNDSIDHYAVSIEAWRMIQVEELLEVVGGFNDRCDFQEKITQELATTLRCNVTTIGFHSGVKTTVVACGQPGTRVLEDS